ncbi:MAG: flagellar filament capping protein FliD [Helicobacter sp.]|uniref:flagellar filament capping protein FliD n=1 Tax=Helicobacter sp. TaxID=218 RepID=UPI0023C088E0|nr:flagellar filament capping protein FliD [Helicobacter sp.]MDE5926076.1 flagellar filament capping protein FliD [Helicobacter sp.]MDE7175300.1 flagellar filament capping protein FliD [Helicobacter sp.]
MAVGQMGVLGIASNLSWDTLNQLKDNDIKNQIDPITKKIETNMEKQTELTSLLTMMTSLNTNFKNLSDFSTYLKRSTSVEGSGVKATAGEGLAIQDIKINVKQLAQNDVNQVGLKFATRDSVFSSENTTLSFYHNGTNYDIEIKAGMTVSEVGQAITDKTNGAVMGIIMKTGGDEPYQLMIQGKDSGAQNKIYFGSTLESAAMPGGQLTSGTFEIEIGGQTISIDLANDVETKIGNTAENNAKALLKAINEKIENDSNLANIKDKLENGEITIGLNSTGKGLLFNDSKGGEIKVNITDAKVKVIEGGSEVDTDLGFVKTSVGASSTDLIKGSAVSSGALSGAITINGERIDLSSINTGSGTGNAQEIANKINTNTNLNGKVSAEVKDGKLVINSLDGNSVRIGAEGADSAEQTKVLNSVGLQMGSYATSQSFLEKMDITNIQKAQNAQFTYNGIEIERDKNSFDDVVSGLSLELTAVTEANKEVIVRVSRDDSGIAEEMEKFVENYNTMYNKIQELMRYDEDTEVAGVFNGNSDIRQILRQFNSIITSNDINGDNLVKYGIYFNDDGTLKMDREKFDSAFKEDPDKAVAFFRSTTSVSRGISTEVDGVFTKLRNTMDKLITGSNSTLKLLETSLVDEQKTLNEDKTKTQEYIDSRYETMASKWSAYDQLIAKTQQQSLAVQNMIQSLYSSNS